MTDPTNDPVYLATKPKAPRKAWSAMSHIEREMFNALAEFVRIDEEGKGLCAHPDDACDLVQALDKARELTGDNDNENKL